MAYKSFVLILIIISLDCSKPGYYTVKESNFSVRLTCHSLDRVLFYHKSKHNGETIKTITFDESNNRIEKHALPDSVFWIIETTQNDYMYETKPLGQMECILVDWNNWLVDRYDNQKYSDAVVEVFDTKQKIYTNYILNITHSEIKNRRTFFPDIGISQARLIPCTGSTFKVKNNKDSDPHISDVIFTPRLPNNKRLTFVIFKNTIYSSSLCPEIPLHQ